MLPRATHTRTARERAQLGGRTQEIQRLIGRSLRAMLDDFLFGDAGAATITFLALMALVSAVSMVVWPGDLIEQSGRRINIVRERSARR